MHPVVLQPLLCFDFLNYILKNHRSPTTLIVCSSRESFLEHLQDCVTHAHRRDLSFEEGANAVLAEYSLLVPTLHLISTSQTIRLAFVPSLPHLRAYLATYRLRNDEDASAPSCANKGLQEPMLAIWGFADLHRSTANYTAQGLSHSLAVAVEGAYLAGQRLVLAEPRQTQDTEDQRNEGASVDAIEHPWNEQVPLLNGSIRFGGDERAWAGKTIEVGKILAKWCYFRRLEDTIISAL